MHVDCCGHPTKKNDRKRSSKSKIFDLHAVVGASVVFAVVGGGLVIISCPPPPPPPDTPEMEHQK